MNEFLRIGSRIKTLRSNHGLTQSDLANCASQTRFNVNISQSYIANLEKSKGDRLPSVPVLCALASTLNTSIDDILGIDKTEKINPLDGLSRQDQTLIMLLANRLANRTQDPIEERRDLLHAAGGDELVNEAFEEISTLFDLESVQ